MWLRIGAILFKEFKQLARDRMTFAMIVMIPLAQLMLFGYAINTDVRHLPAGLVDLSDSSYSRALTQAVAATQVVDFTKTYHSSKEAEAAITRGEVKAVLYLPPDLGERLLHHPGASGGHYLARPVGQWLVDGSDTMVAGAIKSLRQMPLDEVMGFEATRAVPSLEVVQYFNPEQRTVVNIVPGLLGVILTMTMVLFTSAAIVREREQGNMEFLITTPVRPLELMLGKIAPYVLVGFIQVGIILGTGHWLFAVPIRGGLDSLALASFLFICASLTLGLVISTLAQTQLQAMQMTVFILLPSILLSGFMFPYEAMPVAAQWIAEVLPATHFMRMVRAIVLRDAEVVQLRFDSLWLLGFTALGLLVATLKFSKRLD
ncbi:ABC transporter permease [Gallaecimonas kandeliae]|uniref:ABC transporter permease n=1 Tax=Gallaecimonas kandeliae TaxID=3029055 RepID=UPI0026474642|nr:ABC transporter permease [Gallaecimonas kandeliae]WKE67352.1 ABC transporter permease [Gallaecimonas kandeliae]